MIDYTRRGWRVEVKFDLETFYRKFKKGQQGTIICELDNGLGKKLIEVEFDGQGQSPVFVEEIIFLDEAHP